VTEPEPSPPGKPTQHQQVLHCGVQGHSTCTPSPAGSSTTFFSTKSVCGNIALSVMDLEMGLVGLNGGLGDDGSRIISEGWILRDSQRQYQHQGCRKPVHCNMAPEGPAKQGMVKESELFQASASEAAADIETCMPRCMLIIRTYS